MYDRFIQLGIPATLVRTKDETLSPEERIKRILSIGNDPKNILISNHINAGGVTTAMW